MWINFHNEGHYVEKIGKRTIWWNMLLLFSSSLFPYATAIVSSNFNNNLAQVFYGLVVLSITCANIRVYASLERDNVDSKLFTEREGVRGDWVKYTIAIKLIGLFASMTIFAPAMLISVLIALIFFVIPSQLREE